MDKRTILAVVLSVVVISVSMILQGLIWPAQPAPVPSATSQAVEPVVEAPLSPVPVQPVIAPEGEDSLEERTVVLANDVMSITLSSRGAVATSVRLLRHLNRDGSEVEMVLSGESDQYPFSLRFGDYNEPASEVVFDVQGPWPDRPEVVFTRQFRSPSGVPFTLTKTFLLKPSEYMIELRVDMANSAASEELSFGGRTFAYTLGFGPQIGPAYEALDQRNEYRQYVYREAGKKKTARIPRERVAVISETVQWASITGKYFTVAAVPGPGEYDVVYDVRALPGLKDQASVYLERPVFRAARTSDVYRFYMGPKQRDILRRYDDPERNGYRIGDLRLTDTLSSIAVIGWLTTLLRLALELSHRIIPNYGVAIILLTVVIKFLLYPLSKKSFESTAKMQKLNPKIAEIRERYKGKPELMNKELAAFYKKEGINPLGGCLPMLLQLPIFFAFYDLLNTQFELRGAPFIRPWISDLSGPETVLQFGFTIPLLGWSDLKILPFVMLATTLLQTRVSQTPDTGQSNMKVLAYAMPAVFFFILYNMPSGLVLYWTIQNVTGIVQQLVVNRARRAQTSDPGREPPKRRKS
jgi:YidC/Oxa1 family membrane protein insertase